MTFTGRKELEVLDLTNIVNDSLDMPLYEQLYTSMAEAIRKGEIKAGEKLPSKRKLEELLDISHSTVETAYGLLAAEGYIEAVPRVGYKAAKIVSWGAEENRNGAAFTEEGKKPVREKETDLAVRKTSPRELFSLGAVDTELFPYKSWARVYREVLYQSPELLEKGEAMGDLSFRETMASYLREYRGVSCNASQIVIGAGFEYLLERIVDLFASMDESFQFLAVEDPGYPAVARCGERCHRTLVPIEVDEKGLRVEDLEKEAARLVYVTPSHQFPSGATMPMARRMALLNWAKAHDGYIIEDDYDSEFRYHTRPLKALQGLTDGKRVIYIGTFSRTIAPSIRCAYMILPESLVGPYQERFEKSAATVSRFEQQALNRFMEEGLYQRHIRRTSNHYHARSEFLRRCLKETFPGCIIGGGSAGLHLTLSIPGTGAEKISKAALARGIRLHLTKEFTVSGKAYDEKSDSLVLGFAGLNEEKLAKAVKTLADIVNSVDQVLTEGTFSG